MSYEKEYVESVTYIRQKIDQLLEVMGTLPLRPEELDDHTLIELDPIGIIAASFKQVLKHQKEINNELETAQNEIRSIFDSINAAVIVISSSKRIEDFNYLTKEIFFNDRPEQEIYNALAVDIFNCDNAFLDQLINHPEDAQYIEHNGQYFIVNANIITNPDSFEYKSIILCTNITKQKKTEANLKLYESVFNSTAEGIFICDKNTNIIEVNNAYCHMSGYTLDELKGNSPNIFKSHFHDDESYDEMWMVLNETCHWKGEFIDKHKDGTLVPQLQTINRIDSAEA